MSKLKKRTKNNLGLSPSDLALLSRLNTPAKIQDYLNKLAFNLERGGRTHMSVQRVIRHKRAHCIEGALFAAACLYAQGRRPLLLDLRAVKPDFDHVVALFKEKGRWGAISKTRHAVLRYREPVYKSVRELAMSYFHEYFLQDGTKTMRSFSKPFDLARFGTRWLVAEDELFDLAHLLDEMPHEDILEPGQARRLRKADSLERRAAGLL